MMGIVVGKINQNPVRDYRSVEKGAEAFLQNAGIRCVSDFLPSGIPYGNGWHFGVYHSTRYHKLLLTICSLLLLNAFKVQSQIVPHTVSDSIYYNLTLNNNQKKNKKQGKIAFQMNLFIQNKSNDSIVIN